MFPSDSGPTTSTDDSTSSSTDAEPSTSTSAILPSLSALSLCPSPSTSPDPSSCQQRDRDGSLSLDWPTCDSPTTTTTGGPTSAFPITPSQGSHPPGPNCSLDVPPPIPRSRLTSRIRVLKGLLIGRGPNASGGGKHSVGTEGGEEGTVLDGSELKERLERVERELSSWVNASPSPFENNSGSGGGGGGANYFETSPTRATITTGTEDEVGK